MKVTERKHERQKPIEERVAQERAAAAEAEQRRAAREAAEREAAERAVPLREKAEATAASVVEAKLAVDTLGLSPEQLYQERRQQAYWTLRQKSEDERRAREALDRHLRDNRTEELRKFESRLANKEAAVYDHGNVILSRGRWDREEIERNDEEKRQLRYVMIQVRYAFRLSPDDQRAVVKRFSSEFSI
jgi:hypothetical protein